jgi:hypothetical protein
MKKNRFWILCCLIVSHPLFAKSSDISLDHDRLQGRWYQACTTGAVRTEDFQGSRVTLSEIFFLDRDCVRPSVVFLNHGTFVLPGQDAMDFQFSSVGVRLMHEVAVTDYNRRAVCGLKDWVLGVEKEISGRSCEIFAIGFPQKIPTVGEMRFGLYHLDGDRLSFGKLGRDKNATTPEKRPAELDPRFYTKIPHVRPTPTNP